MRAVKNPADIIQILSSSTKSTPNFLHESSIVFRNAISVGGGKFLLSDKRSFLGLIIPNHSGIGIHSIFVLTNENDLEEENLFKASSYVFENFENTQGVWMLNIPMNKFSYSSNENYKVIPFDKETGYERLNNKSYQLESNFGQVIYCLKNLEWSEELSPYKKNDFTFRILKGPNFSNLRYTSKRIIKRYDKISLFDKPTENDLIECVYEWKETMSQRFSMEYTVNSTKYDRKFFMKYWLRPILDFVKFSYALKFTPILIKRLVKTINNDKGFWIGYEHKNSLIINVFVTNRRDSLFADLLLLDIINFAIGENIKYINLGGSEDLSLFKFKKKYIDSFEGSFVRKTDSALFMMPTTSNSKASTSLS